MSNYYNNVPQSPPSSSSDQTVQIFDQYFQNPIELNNAALVVMVGFFQSRGFDVDAAESTAIIILQQAKKDQLNPMEIMDTLGGLTDVEISQLVGEILNFNRYKTSSLGLVQGFTPAEQIIRNVVA